MKNQVKQDAPSEAAPKAKKVYVNINKNYVQTGLQSKLKDGSYRSYNKVSLPGGTNINGKDVSGYYFYPLYVNQNKVNPNVKDIPFIKDSIIQLHKGEQVMEVMAQEIADAVKDSYLNWKREKEESRDLQKESGAEDAAYDVSDIEFGWQGVSFPAYMKVCIEDGFDEIKGLEIYGEDMPLALVRNNGRQWMAFNGGDYESKMFIKEHFWEAADFAEYAKGKFEEGIDPFLNSERFCKRMVEKGVYDELSQSEYFKSHKEHLIKLDNETIDKIKSEIGITGDKGIEKSIKMPELDVEVEL